MHCGGDPSLFLFRDILPSVKVLFHCNSRCCQLYEYLIYVHLLIFSENPSAFRVSSKNVKKKLNYLPSRDTSLIPSYREKLQKFLIKTTFVSYNVDKCACVCACATCVILILLGTSFSRTDMISMNFNLRFNQQGRHVHRKHVSPSGSRDVAISWNRLPLPKVNPRGNPRHAPRDGISGSCKHDRCP